MQLNSTWIITIWKKLQSIIKTSQKWKSKSQSILHIFTFRWYEFFLRRFSGFTIYKFQIEPITYQQGWLPLISRVTNIRFCLKILEQSEHSSRNYQSQHISIRSNLTNTIWWYFCLLSRKFSCCFLFRYFVYDKIGFFCPYSYTRIIYCTYISLK